MSRSERTLYAVGKIVKAFGIKGEVVILPMTDPERRNRFTKLKRVFVGRNEQNVKETAVELVRVQPRGVRMKMRSIADRTEAERVVGCLVFVEEADRIRLPRGTFFVHEIVGMEVVDEQGERLGIVKEVLRQPAHDIYVIDHEGREVMIPAVREFVLSISRELRRMRVRLLEGMVE